MIKEATYYKITDNYFTDYLFVATISDGIVTGIRISIGLNTISAGNSYFQYDGNFGRLLSSIENYKLVEITKEEFDDALKKMEDLIHGIRTDFI